MFSFGASLIARGNLLYAERVFEECLQAIQLILAEKRASDPTSRYDAVGPCADIHLNLGGVYCVQGKYNEALLHYEQCLELTRRLHAKPHLDLADVLMSFGNHHLAQFNYETAMKMFNEALGIYRIIHGNSHITLARAKQCIYFTHRQMGNADMAMQVGKEALQLASMDGSDPNLVSIIKADLCNVVVHRNLQLQKLELYF